MIEGAAYPLIKIPAAGLAHADWKRVFFHIKVYPKGIPYALKNRRIKAYPKGIPYALKNRHIKV